MDVELTTGQLDAVTFVASPAVAVRLLPAAGAGAVVLLAEIAWLSWRTTRQEVDDDPMLARPMSLRAALSLTLVLVALLVITRAAADWLGGGGVVTAAALGGLADAHASSMAAASLAPQVISVNTAVLACGAALATNTVVKLVLAGIAGGPKFAVLLGVWLLPVAAVVAAGLAW